MAFDITKALGGIAARSQESQRQQLQYIPLHMIDSNPKNLYSMDGIEDLAANIQMFGLMQPLVVRKTDQGRYVLISGHRRRAALRMLAEQAENYPASMSEPVACLVDPEDADLPGIEAGGNDAVAARAMAEELKLIYANSDTRVLSSADTARQVRRIRELLQGLADMGYKLPGRMRDRVAEAAKISATRVARLDVISRNLIAPFREAWEARRLGETAAYEIARRDPDVQKRAAERVPVAMLPEMNTDSLTALLDACETDSRENEEIRDKWNRDVTNMAEATGTEPSFSADEYLEQVRQEDELFREMLADPEILPAFIKGLGSQRFRSEAIAALKDLNKTRGGCWSRILFDGSAKGLKLERFRPKEKRTAAITRSWTDVYDALCLILLQQANEQPQAEKPAKVSAADTGPQWQTGTPEEPGDYVICCGIPKEEIAGSWMKSLQRWSGDRWVDARGVPVRLNVYRWIRIPEV